jgi:hypothetical protein
MLAQITDACTKAAILPDAVLSGHAHNYQRHTRLESDGRETPFVVAGGGGHAFQRVDPAAGQHSADHIFEKSFAGYGYLLITASATRLRIDYHPLGDSTEPTDTVRVPIGI